jgi:hypothetical protein
MSPSSQGFFYNGLMVVSGLFIPSMMVALF